MSTLIRNIKLIIFLVAIISTLITGCATPGQGGPVKSLSLKPDYKYKVENVTVSDTEKYEVDAEGLLQRALENSLKEKNMLLEDTAKNEYYLLSAQILDYDMGNAFKRWLMPGYGSTILTVHTDVKDNKTGETIASMEHRSTVAAGGLYSVGAWEDIFSAVASDITTDLERRHTGSGEGFFVNLDPWLEKEEQGPEIKQSQELRLIAFSDKRTEKNRIGERHAAFNVSMGDIYTNRDVAAYFTEAVHNELLASGNRLSDNAKDITIGGDVMKFWIWTNTTALYWDIISEIEVNLYVISPRTNKSLQKLYKATSTTRTYIYPSQKLVEEVVSESIRKLMLEIRMDSPWTRFSESSVTENSGAKELIPIAVVEPGKGHIAKPEGLVVETKVNGRFPRKLADREIVSHFIGYKHLTFDDVPRYKFTIQVLSGSKDGRFFNIERECLDCYRRIGDGQMRIKYPNLVCFNWSKINYPPSVCMELIQVKENRFELVDPKNNERFGYSVPLSGQDITDERREIENSPKMKGTVAGARPPTQTWQVPQRDINDLADCQSQAPNIGRTFDPLSGYFLFEGSDAEKYRKCLKEKHGWFNLGPPDYEKGTMAPPR